MKWRVKILFLSQCKICVENLKKLVLMRKEDATNYMYVEVIRF